MGEEALDETTASKWQEIGLRDELVPGDLLATHRQPDPAYHVGFSCWRVGGQDLVYDSSPRGLVPLFDERGTLVEDREIQTRYARATETTHCLRDDGGAYLRLWDDRMRYFHTGLHERLLAAGLDGLPFYCRRRLSPAAAACRCAAPTAALGPGHSYYWYVMPTNAGGHEVFAPAEGVFSITERG